MTATIAQPTPDDAAAMATLGRRCFTETFGHLYRPQDLAAFLETHTPDRWHRHLTDPAYAIRAAYADGEPVGFAKLAPVSLPVDPTGPAIELRQFYLLASQHGTGLAQQLMAWVLDESHARGAHELFLSVFIDNPRARRFYERFGFERVGRYAFMVGEQADEDDIMRLRL